MMIWWNHALPKGNEIRCSRNSEHFLSHMWQISYSRETSLHPKHVQNDHLSDFESVINEHEMKYIYNMYTIIRIVWYEIYDED